MWTCPRCNEQTDDSFNVCWHCRESRDESRLEGRVPRTLVTTTHSFSTHEIVEYLGPVFGESIHGTTILQDLAAGLAGFLGGRSKQYESLFASGREAAIREMLQSAETLGGNAVVGMTIQHQLVGETLFLISVTGTAVRATEKPTSASS